MSAQQEEDLFVDPASMTVVLRGGDVAIMPVDCDTDDWIKAAEECPYLRAWPLPDGRVAVLKI